MTIIVYKDGILAADSLISDGNLGWGNIKKIAKTKSGYLAGSAGHQSKVIDFLVWAKKEDFSTLPPTKHCDNESIIITPKGEIWFYENSHNFVKMKNNFIALGDGAAIAMGAVFMGANAQEAVKAAIAYCITCGGDVRYEKLDSYIKKVEKEDQIL